LVAGHYLPLADNPGVAPESDQTRSLQSIQRTLCNPAQPGYTLLSKGLGRTKRPPWIRLCRATGGAPL